MKPGNYTQLYIHLVFAVKNKEALLLSPTKHVVFSYMSRIASELHHKSIIVNGTSDHVHVFLGLNPSMSISDTVHELKRVSSKYINSQKMYSGVFAWQEGYGAFSYGHSQIDQVYKYIQNQEEHHAKLSFKDEYLKLLEKFDLKYDDRYLFDFFDKGSV